MRTLISTHILTTPTARILTTAKTLTTASLIGSGLFLSGCGTGASGDSQTRALDDAADAPVADVQLTVDLPQRMQNLGIALNIVVTVAGETRRMNKDNTVYYLDIDLPLERNYPVFFAVRRNSDSLILASAQTELVTDAEVVPFAVPPQLFDTSYDSDSDGYSNIAEIERGTEPNGVSEDFDGDGIANETDADDDNDGVADIYDAFPLNASETVDTDGDGIGNNLDYDDDNDLINDVDDKFPLDASESLDLDLDGLGNSVDNDDDGDGTIDLEDPQPSNPNITGNEDSDGDGFRDLEDAFPYNSSEHNDVDGDGVGDNADDDDDNNGIPDDQDDSVVGIPYSTNIPTIDGAYGWNEWWDGVRSDSRGNDLRIDHLLIDNDGNRTDGESNSGYYWNYSYWRAKHDGTHLYLLIVAIDEPFYERFGDSPNVWDDDSVDVYFDIGNEKSDTYDTNDYHRLFRYHDNLSDDQLVGYHSAPGMIAEHVSSLSMEMANSTRNIFEIKINLASIGLSTEQRFGFDTHINDDDNGADRDAKWAWFAPSGQDETWRNPSTLGTAVLAPVRVVTNTD